VFVVGGLESAAKGDPVDGGQVISYNDASDGVVIRVLPQYAELNLKVAIVDSELFVAAANQYPNCGVESWSGVNVPWGHVCGGFVHGFALARIGWGHNDGGHVVISMEKNRRRLLIKSYVLSSKKSFNIVSYSWPAYFIRLV